MATRTKRTAAHPTRRPKKSHALGRLPEWNLADLYPAIDAPEVQRDLDRADAECLAFEDSCKGQLAALAATGGSALAAVVKRYEAIDDLIGRLLSYAGLV